MTARTRTVTGIGIVIAALAAGGCYSGPTGFYGQRAVNPYQQYNAAMHDMNMARTALDMLNLAEPYAIDQETQTWIALDRTLANHLVRDAQRRASMAQLRMRP